MSDNIKLYQFLDSDEIDVVYAVGGRLADKIDGMIAECNLLLAKNKVMLDTLVKVREAESILDVYGDVVIAILQAEGQLPMDYQAPDEVDVLIQEAHRCK